MSKTVDFLSTRRSVTAKMMKPGHVKKEDLDLILNTGLRVPDHGGLKPWKVIVFRGNSRKKFDEEVILKEYKANNTSPTPEIIKMETNVILWGSMYYNSICSSIFRVCGPMGYGMVCI